MNVFETLSHSAKQWPDRIAIIDAGGPLDYRSLWREVEALRVQLDRLGVREGQGVGVRARNGRAFVIGALGGAGMRRGHHAHPSPDEAGRIGGHAGARALVRDSRRRLRPGPARQNRPAGKSGRQRLALHAAGRPAIAARAGNQGRRVRAVHFGNHRQIQGRGADASRRAGTHPRRQFRSGPDVRGQNPLGAADGLSLLRVHHSLPRSRRHGHGQRRLSGRAHPGRGRETSGHVSLRDPDAHSHVEQRKLGTCVAAFASAGDVRFEPTGSASGAGFSCTVSRPGVPGFRHHRSGLAHHEHRRGGGTSRSHWPAGARL